MAANLAMKEEFTVGWGFYLNNKNTVASQNSRGSENLTDQKMVLTPLTTAPYGAQTLVLSGFQGGGGAAPKTRSTSAFQAHHSKCILFTRTKQCKELNVLADLRTDVANECEQIRIANGMSRLVRKHKRRDSVSVEQIQDTSYSLSVFKRNTS